MKKINEYLNLFRRIINFTFFKSSAGSKKNNTTLFAIGFYHSGRKNYYKLSDLRNVFSDHTRLP